VVVIDVVLLLLLLLCELPCPAVASNSEQMMT